MSIYVNQIYEFDDKIITQIYLKRIFMKPAENILGKLEVWEKEMGKKKGL